MPVKEQAVSEFKSKSGFKRIFSAFFTPLMDLNLHGKMNMHFVRN